MAREATVERDRASTEAGRNQSRTGTIEAAGRKADEVVELLRAEGYEVQVKKLVPAGPEASLTLEVSYGTEPSLFD